MSKKTFCDICHREISNVEEKVRISMVEHLWHEAERVVHQYDEVCQQCYVKIANYVESFRNKE